MGPGRHAIFIPECVADEATLTAPKDITALEIIPAGAAARLGQLVPVTKGARLQVCAHGFNDRTLKLRYAERFFFVFLRDVESRSSSALGADAHGHP